MDFEWDEEKERKNRAVHGFTFEDAARAFLDPFHEVIFDSRMNYGEERLTVFGMVQERLLAVTYTVRGETIRIISARKASRHERRQYEDQKI